MATHDKYDHDILKQLTRIANALEEIERKLPEQISDDIDEPPREEKSCDNCIYYGNPHYTDICRCCHDHIYWRD